LKQKVETEAVFSIKHKVIPVKDNFVKLNLVLKVYFQINRLYNNNLLLHTVEAA
jgi:hypothetical protein